MKKYYSVTELVEMGYGSRSTIMNHIAIGTFTARNPGGGKWLIDLESYEEWLKTRQKMKWRNSYEGWRYRNTLASQ